MGPGGGGGFRSTEFYLVYPRQLAMPWFSMYNPRLKRGVYYATHDPVAREKVLRFEMHPSLARNRLGTNWPTSAEIARMRRKHPPGVVMHWVYLPFLPPGGSFRSAPAVLECHEGDWHAAAKIYRRWFVSQFPLPRPTSWLRRAQAVLNVIFLLPEGNVLWRFRDIPRLAREAARYGVKALLVSGWWTGGHDNQYPDYRPDPRLGTWSALRKGIAAAHRLGVKVYFFSNIQTVDLSTPWYKRKLHEYATTKPNGFDWWMSFGMGTVLARMGYTAPPLGNCDPAFPAYRRIIVRQMRKLAEAGADGVHYDKVIVCFPNTNPCPPASPDRSMYEGVLKCMEETLRECRKVHPEFCVGVESSWDRLLPYCDSWWDWVDGLDHVRALKYAFPEWLPTTAVVQAYDYNSVNNAVRMGNQLLIGPAHWSQSLHDEQMRPLAGYIREVLRIREELADTLYLGEFLDHQEVRVLERPQLKFNSHRNPKTGQRACVLVNQGRTPLTTTTTFAKNPGGRVRIHRPFGKTLNARLSARVTIPGERFAVVVEDERKGMA